MRFLNLPVDRITFHLAGTGRRPRTQGRLPMLCTMWLMNLDYPNKSTSFSRKLGFGSILIQSSSLFSSLHHRDLLLLRSEVVLHLSLNCRKWGISPSDLTAELRDTTSFSIQNQATGSNHCDTGLQLLIESCLFMKIRVTCRLSCHFHRLASREPSLKRK